MTIAKLQEMVEQFYFFVREDEKQTAIPKQLAGEMYRFVCRLNPSQTMNQSIIDSLKTSLIQYWNWAIEHAVKDEWRTNGLMNPWLHLQRQFAENNWLVDCIEHPFFHACLVNEFHQFNNKNTITLPELWTLLNDCQQSFEADYGHWQVNQEIPVAPLVSLFVSLHSHCNDKQRALLIALNKTLPTSDAVKSAQNNLLTTLCGEKALWLIFFQSKGQSIGNDPLQMDWSKSVIAALRHDFAIEPAPSVNDNLKCLNALLDLIKTALTPEYQRSIVTELYQFCVEECYIPGWKVQAKADTIRNDSGRNLTFFENQPIKQKRVDDLLSKFAAFEKGPATPILNPEVQVGCG